MARDFAGLRPLFTTLALALLQSACGGGGGATDAAPGPSATSISGNAVKGPVQGATVTAYAIAGGAMGQQLGSATTDGLGAFTMPISGSAGPVMLRMSGGSYVDEATGGTVTMAPGQVMTTVLSSLPGGTATVQVTPLTAMAQAMAAGMPGGMTAANIDAANAAVGAYFMVGDIVHTPVMNPLVVGSGVNATPAMANYGAMLAAMSQYAKSVGSPSASFVGAMMQDAADGVLDGKSGTTPIGMGGGMMGGGMMQSSAGAAGLAGAMADFMNSSANRSGVTSASMSPLMQQMAASGGRLR